MQMTTQQREEILLSYNNVLGQDSIEFMIESGFCICPASTKHHGDYEGGLFDHSFAMVQALQDLTNRLHLKWEGEHSASRVAWLHDLCKLDSYEKVYDREPHWDESTGDKGVWHFDYSKDKLLGGHGEKSVVIALQHTKLTEEEIMCIRYHMGAYIKDDWDYFDKAIKKYPNVLYTHTADMIASKIMGV